jgi:transcriptional regulator with XRE-family HTH domain
MAREKLEEPHPVDIHVGRRVQEKRLGLGLTQSALARALGVSFQQVQKYEKGTNRVSASKLFEMADFMKVEIPYFFSGFRAAQAGVGEEEAAAFDHEPRMTKHSVEIARLAPHLPLRNQKLILDMIREMLGDAAEKPS